MPVIDSNSANSATTAGTSRSEEESLAEEIALVEAVLERRRHRRPTPGARVRGAGTAIKRVMEFASRSLGTPGRRRQST
jgi:hypothetical protein